MRAIAAITLAFATALPAAAQPVMYSVLDLGIVSGGNNAAINASGQTAGITTVGGVAMAFRGSANGQITYLGATNSNFIGINDSGQVAGDSSALGFMGVLTTATGDFSTATVLGPPGGSSEAFVVNGIGQVAGRAIFPGNSGDLAVRTTPGGVYDATANLGTLPGGTVSSARAINAAGQVTGTARVLGDTATHAYRTTATGALSTAVDLGVLGGGQTSIGYAINASGQVAGESFLASGGSRAFRSSASGQPVSIQDLGTLAGGYSEAWGINALGVVVGDSDGAGYVYDTQMHNLNTMVPAGWNIGVGFGINDAGQIVASGSFQGGPGDVVVLTPVPVPEPSALALTGLAGVWLAWRRMAHDRRSRCKPTKG
jgi:probable HAF family extracellular repeat protein